MSQNSAVTLDICPGDVEILREAVGREMKRWPAEHIMHFNCLRLYNTLASTTRKIDAHKPARSKKP